MDTICKWLLFSHSLIYVPSLVGSSTPLNTENVRGTRSMKSSGKSAHSSPIAFGGILNHWLHQVVLNDTDVRRAAKFAVKYAKRTQPDMFPDKTDVKYIHKVKDISKLKLTFTSDNINPALFSALDPVLQKPVTMPIVWGLMYAFQIMVYTTQTNFVIVHEFTVLEYIDEETYILEHSFHCSGEKGVEPFGYSCMMPQLFSGNSDKSTAETFSDDCDVSGTNIDQSHGTEQISGCTDQSCSSLHSKDNTLDSKCSNPDQSKLNYQKKGSQLPGSIQHLTHTKSHFSLLSYNVWNTNVFGEFGNPDLRYVKRIQHLTKICQDVHADVIAFQEVRFEDGKGGVMGPNQLHHLSTLLPDYQYVFQPGQVQSHGLPSLIIEGVAIFSRHPIVSRKHLLLTRNPSDVADGHQRVLLHAEIEIPFVGKVHVLNTHLSLSHQARLLSVLEIWEYAQTLEGPVFLAGDFNAETHNEEVRFLAGKYTFRGHKTRGFHDIWETYHGVNNKGFTFNTLEASLSKRIDLIFFKEHSGLALTGAEIIDDKTRRHSASSDHLALLAKFAMQN